MKALLPLAFAIDKLNDGFGRLAQWAVVASCVISAGNAVVRYGLNIGSNAWLEIQWYLFAVCVMLGAAQVLRLNEHVRVDLVYSRYPTGLKVWVDILGILCFLMPVMGAMLYFAWPLFLDRLDEVSDSRFGAAVLSVEAQFQSLGVMLFAPLVGRAVDHFGLTAAGVCALVAATAVGVFPFHRRRPAAS